jgi:hypothetical protein
MCGWILIISRSVKEVATGLVESCGDRWAKATEFYMISRLVGKNVNFYYNDEVNCSVESHHFTTGQDRAGLLFVRLNPWLSGWIADFYIVNKFFVKERGV